MAKPLYKFVNGIEHVGSIISGSLKFSAISELNDPSELVPNVIRNEVENSLHRLRSEGYTESDLVWLRRQGSLLDRLAPSFMIVAPPKTVDEANDLIQSAAYDDISALEDILIEVADLMSERLGVLCLTRNISSLPMWAHYAGNATGFAIEYNDLESIFKGDNTGVLSRPVEVRYERDRTGVTFDPRSHESLFFSKFSDWSYEKEVRIVVPLSDCKETDVGTSVIHCRNVEKKYITGLICGWKMSAAHKDRVRKISEELNPDVQLNRAVIDHGFVKIIPTDLP